MNGYFAEVCYRYPNADPMEPFDLAWDEFTSLEQAIAFCKIHLQNDYSICGYIKRIVDNDLSDGNIWYQENT